MLLNCYSPDAQFSTNAQNIADAHRRTGDVHYSLMDFNLSLCAPLDTPLESYYRPSEEALVGAPCYLPSDISLGEQFYNPFAYDVACLGNMYRVFFTVRRHPNLRTVVIGLTIP